VLSSTESLANRSLFITSPTIVMSPMLTVAITSELFIASLPAARPSAPTVRVTLAIVVGSIDALSMAEPPTVVMLIGPIVPLTVTLAFSMPLPLVVSSLAFVTVSDVMLPSMLKTESALPSPRMPP